MRIYVHDVSEYDVDFHGRPLPAHARVQNIIHGQNGNSNIRHTRMVYVFCSVFLNKKNNSLSAIKAINYTG